MMIHKNLSRHAPRRVRLAATVLLGIWCAACTVAGPMRSEKGVDVSGIQLGVTRAEAEAILGSPLGSWSSEGGVNFAAYQVDKGIPPGSGDPEVPAIFAVLTLGLSELIDVSPYEYASSGKRRFGRLVIAYDMSDVIIGLFNKFDPVPPDGRSDARPSVLDPNK